MAFEPSKITREHVWAAVKKIEEEKIPLWPSTRWEVIINDRAYPPKEIMRYAHELMNGEYIWTKSGGEPTNSYLAKMGFKINHITNTNPIRTIFEKLKVAISADEKLIFKKQKYDDQNDKYWIWFGDQQGLIGKDDAHYEVLWEKDLISVDLHFEGTSKSKRRFQTLIEGLQDPLQSIPWQKYQSIRYGTGIPLSANEFKTLIEEELIALLKNQLYFLDSTIGSKVRVILDPTNKKELSKRENMELPLNQILYGPPGTGKTFNSINKALEILGENLEGKTREEIKAEFDKKAEEGQIIFTTFHQSMSYEDFIEGIKPQKPLATDTFVKYEVQEGILKKISEQAQSNFENSQVENQEKIPFEQAFERLKEDWELNNEIKFPLKTEGYDYTIIGFTNTSIQFKKASGGTSHTLSINTLKELYYGKEYNFKQGVGIYYPAILSKINEYSEGNKFKTKLKNFVLIIDEINRGNVSQIFGELITLIEEDKRMGKAEALKLTLPYSKNKFSVPPNLYLIGTMNTADRSVEALDIALRRRFSFIEMPPDPQLIISEGKLKDKNGVCEGINLSQLLRTINTRIEKLLDRDHQIGHSYFLSVGSLNDLKLAFQNKIIPLLQEYFFGDYGKIGLVLGKGFVQRKEAVREQNTFADFDYEDSGDFETRPIFEIVDYTKENLRSIKIGEKTVEMDMIKAVKLLMKQDIE